MCPCHLSLALDFAWLTNYAAQTFHGEAQTLGLLAVPLATSPVASCQVLRLSTFLPKHTVNLHQLCHPTSRILASACPRSSVKTMMAGPESAPRGERLLCHKDPCVARGSPRPGFTHQQLHHGRTNVSSAAPNEVLPCWGGQTELRISAVLGAKQDSLTCVYLVSFKASKTTF